MTDFKDVSEMHLDDPNSVVSRLTTAAERAVSWMDIAQTDAQERTREAWSKCEDLALDANILARLRTTLTKSGYVGDTRAAALLFLVVLTRLLTRPVSVAVKGPSAAGKSFLVDSVLPFFPPTAYYVLTAMSERALAYSQEPLQNRFLVLAEEAGMSGEFQSYLIRTLLSEGRLRYETVEKTAHGMRARLIERDGPTGLILTTTRVKVHHENETRLLTVPVTDTQEHTAAILESTAREDTEVVDMEPWHALQQYLENARYEVTIPYSSILARRIPPVAVRLRRDFPALLSLIRAHAILHSATRRRNDEGRVVATFDDYAGVRELVVEIISAGVDSTVPPAVRETVETVARLREQSTDPINVSTVARALQLDKSSALRRVHAAIDHAYLENLEDRKGRPARLVLGEPMPADVEVLPYPEDLANSTMETRTSAPAPLAETSNREEFTV
jgi:hypothetical protein